MMTNHEVNQTGNFGIGNVSGGTVENTGTIAGVVNEGEQKRTLAEAAQEIQELLQQLDKSYSTETRPERMTFAEEAIKQVEENPSLFENTLQVLRAGGSAALEKSLDHPVTAFLLAGVNEYIKIQKHSKS